MVGSAAPVWGDVAQLDGLGDRLGTGLDMAGHRPEVVSTSATHRSAAAVGRVGRVIGSTEPALSNLC
jgi:hypothetical protein